MDLGLAGRVYVLTGASRGLGFATAQCLVEDGAHVVISARQPDRLADAAASLNATGPGTAAGVTLDNADPTAPGQLIGTALEQHGRLDGALISVGGPPRGTAAAIGDDQWRESFETVFLGALRIARAVAHRLSGPEDGVERQQTGGAIGFVLSASVRTPMSDVGLSNGLRPGLAGVAKDMADEFGPRNVRVVSLLPAHIYTERLREVYAASDDPAATMASAAGASALKRLGEPEEFGRVAAFALSPAASYLTGLTVAVDGGTIRSL